MTLNEAETRQQLIDRQLLLAGWDVSDPSQVIQELDIYIDNYGLSQAAQPRDSYKGHRFADYALLKDGKPIAVIEAKRTSKDAALGQEQALQYARQLQDIHGGRIPFVLSRLGEMNARQISEYSHKDIPWITTEDGDQIKYESVFYRSPEYSIREGLI